MADQKSLKKGASSSSIDDGQQRPNTKRNLNKPIISADKMEELHNDSAASSEQDNNEYCVGDIVWAKIGKYPFWPSIVCYDPNSSVYMKGTPKDKKKFSLHVRFCNDNGRRSWAKILEKYYGKEDLISKYPNCTSFIKNSKKQMNTWNTAIKEADSWLKFDREERWKQFADANNIKPEPTKSPPKSPPKSAQSSTATTSNTSPRGTNALKKKADDSSQSAPPDSYLYLKNLSVGHLTEEDLKKIKIANRKTKTKKVSTKNSISNYSFTFPEKSYFVDKPVPTHPHRRVLERLKCDVEKLEAEGIRKIREWKASKLAKAANASITTATQ